MVYTLDNINEQTKSFSIVEKRLVRGNNSKPKYQLLNEIKLELSNGDIVTIPEGFIWDLSTVPRFLWWLLPPDGDFDLAYLLHDYLWIYKTELPYRQVFTDNEMLKWSKKTNGTKKMSFRNIDNYIRYFFVRLLGWIVWNGWIKIK